jgi:hypothetical protein
MAIFPAVYIFLLQLASAQLGDILSYKYQRYSECSSLLETCQPTISSESPLEIDAFPFTGSFSASVSNGLF